MARIPDAIFLLLFVVLAPALVTGQEVQDTWLDGETLMLEMVSPAAPGKAVLEQFHPDCRVAMDSVMTRHIGNASDEPLQPALLCREPQHWEAVRRYVREFQAHNDTTARFMRPSGIGAPWMVRYALRCRSACLGGAVGFEIRFTYDGRRVTRVELQTR
jgi:hypothetical protein